MSDYIERDKAIDAIREHIKDIDGDNDALDYIATNMLKDVPSARPKGEWIKNIDGNYECSKCHVAIRGEDKPIYPFCAWCGADMREREGE